VLRKHEQMEDQRIVEKISRSAVGRHLLPGIRGALTNYQVIQSYLFSLLEAYSAGKCIDRIPNVKFFITSRLDAEIYQGYQLPHSPSTHTNSSSQSHTMESDIKLYLEMSVSTIAAISLSSQIHGPHPMNSRSWETCGQDCSYALQPLSTSSNLRMTILKLCSDLLSTT
jgi:hypothetical protein